MTRFDCLDASYQLLDDLCAPLGKIRERDARLHTQLRTAAASISLNIAEGRARAGKDKRHLWRVALGSTEEVQSILHVAVRLRDITEQDATAAHATLDRLRGMLWRMTH